MLDYSKIIIHKLLTEIRMGCTTMNTDLMAFKIYN